jgi:hypothetical protein
MFAWEVARRDLLHLLRDKIDPLATSIPTD